MFRDRNMYTSITCLTTAHVWINYLFSSLFVPPVDGYLSVDELHKVLTSIGKEKFTEEQVMLNPGHTERQR